MQNFKIYPVILSGGHGSRLWPLSNKNFPKQFCSLTSAQSLLQDTLCRTWNKVNFHAPTIVCQKKYLELLVNQIDNLNITPLKIITEPIGRNTAPAITLAAFTLFQQDSEAVMLIQPSDHLIKDGESFLTTLNIAYDILSNSPQSLITFGAPIQYPETGYGYIKKGKAVLGFSNSYHVEKFIEKPNVEMATQLMNSDSSFWNSGIFLFKVKSYFSQLQKTEPELYNICEKSFSEAKDDGKLLEINEKIFSQAKNISIDYAVMEKTQDAIVVSLDCDWADVGNWDSVYQISQKDEFGNVVKGSAVIDQMRNSYISSDGRLVAAIGLSDVVIVANQDAVLVVAKDQTQKVKELSNQFFARGNKFEE